MDLQKFVTSSNGVLLGLAIGKTIPPKLGYKISIWAARILVKSSKSRMVKAVKQNQWVVRGGELTTTELDDAAEEVFSHAGRCFIDLYHNIRNPNGLKSLVRERPYDRELIRNSQERNQGAFFVAPHISAFDLCLLAFAYRGLQCQVISYGQPTGGYKIQNDIRSRTGLNITPASPEVHQQAIENMRTGGFVVTGIDRPIRRKAHMLTFFERPCPLPAGHIRMALEAQVPVIVASASMNEKGSYSIEFSDPISMIEKNDTEASIKINGEKILSIIEERIIKNPGQWLMYYPAWPDVDLTPFDE